MGRKKSFQIFILLALMGILAAIIISDISEKRDYSDKGDRDSLPSPEIHFDFSPPAILVMIKPDLKTAQLRASSSTALDGLTLEQIVQFRLKQVQKYKHLCFFHPEYHPLKHYHKQIYKQINSAKPWLGPTPYYIANPYLLIVLTRANHVTPLNLYCPDVEIVYNHGKITETRKGYSARCWFEVVFRSPDYPGKIWPVSVNAWDAGFFYIFVDLNRSINILSDPNQNHISRKATNIRYFYHVGKYKKNNISPSAVHAWLKLKQKNVFTRVYMKLWQNSPSSLKNRPDLIYIFNINPEY